VGERQPYAATEEYPRNLEYLTEEIGLTEREAELCLRDGDLWPFIDVGSMYPFEGQEGIRNWQDALDTLHSLYGFFTKSCNNPALQQILSEDINQAEAMLGRLRERVKEASEE
jgi:hypothetical protein